MIFNGLIDVMGHKTQQVLEALDHISSISAVSSLALQPLENSSHYQMSLGALEVKEETQEEAGDTMPATIWIAYIDQDHAITVADGANRGREVTYKNIVSAVEELQVWDGSPLTFTFNPALEDKHKGFLVFVQSQTTGKILASSTLMVRSVMQSEESES